MNYTEKMQTLPGKLLYRDLILIMLCMDFVLFLKGKILKEFQNIEKFVIFWKSMILKKAGMQSYISPGQLWVPSKLVERGSI